MMHSLDQSEPEQDVASDEQNTSGISIRAAVIGSRVSGMAVQDILELTNEDVETEKLVFDMESQEKDLPCTRGIEQQLFSKRRDAGGEKDVVGEYDETIVDELAHDISVKRSALHNQAHVTATTDDETREEGMGEDVVPPVEGLISSNRIEASPGAIRVYPIAADSAMPNGSSLNFTVEEQSEAPSPQLPEQYPGSDADNAAVRNHIIAGNPGATELTMTVVAQAEKVDLQDAVIVSSPQRRRKKFVLVMIGILLMMTTIVALAVMLSRSSGADSKGAGTNSKFGTKPGSSNKPTLPPSHLHQQPTLQAVKERGSLRCFHYNFGFSVDLVSYL